MTASPARTNAPVPLRACAVSRDMAEFALLIEDLETELGSDWGTIPFEDALAYLRGPEAKSLEFLAITLDVGDEAEEPLAEVTGIISIAKTRGIPVILIAEDIRPAILHRLLRAGADDFVPYPPPEQALHEARERLRTPAPEALAHGPVLADLAAPGGAPPEPVRNTHFSSLSRRDGTVLAIHGFAGGVGATTFAVNLGWELANPAMTRKHPGDPAPRVCLIDLDLQFGAIATYLDLPRREAVFELLSDTSHMDAESFGAALQVYNDRLHVLTAPEDVLPLDFITGDDVARLIDMARSRFDFVLIDMPKALVTWSEAVLARAQICFTLMELELRSAQNAQRMMRTYQAENLPVEKLRHILNRAPKFSDMTGRSRVKRLSEGLGISIEIQLPDGGHTVTVANDQALPLARTLPRSPLRQEIQRLAQSIVDQERARMIAQG